MSAGYADTIPSDSFLEYAFLRWVLTPAATDGVLDRVHAQAPVHIDGHDYRLDYEIRGDATVIAIELDGFAVHGTRSAFTYDRMRQNDVTGTGRAIARFSYDAIRTDTARCVMQLQALLARDPLLATFVRASPVIETPQMDPDPLMALSPSPRAAGTATPSAYFAETVAVLDIRTLRECQRQAFTALSNYYATGGKQAACVMSVGAGKTVLGVAAVLSFTRRRALVVTPGNVIRGTFDRAFDPHAVGNALYGLPGGPLIPGQRPPAVLTLDRAAGGLRNTTRAQLLAADVIVTNFHSLGTGASPEDLLAKLDPDDIDMIVIDEAHIAAAASYQRLFAHFSAARTLLMSACFTRLDGKPIDADVVYRYRLIDSIADGNAKNMRIRRFEPDTAASIYEVLHPDGRREELVGRDALLAVLGDERKLANITAKSTEPIHRVMRVVAAALAVQRECSTRSNPECCSPRWDGRTSNRSPQLPPSTASAAVSCTTPLATPPTRRYSTGSNRTPGISTRSPSSGCSAKAMTSHRSASPCHCAPMDPSASSTSSSAAAFASCYIPRSPAASDPTSSSSTSSCTANSASTST